MPPVWVAVIAVFGLGVSAREVIAADPTRAAADSVEVVRAVTTPDSSVATEEPSPPTAEGGAAVPDSLASERPPPAAEPGGSAPVPSVDWPRAEGSKTLLSPSLPLEVARLEVERAGGRTPFQVLSYVPGYWSMEVASVADVGALATAGSFGRPRLQVDGWQVRLPRLEGKDLSAMLLDRLSPHAGYSHFGSIGSLQVGATDPSLPNSRGTVRFSTVEATAAEGARSRVAIYTAGYGFTGGGLTLSDRRGPFSYGIGIMNASADRSGAIAGTSTRLAAIDLGWRFDRWQLLLDTRNSERDVTWKSGQGLKLDNQGVRMAALLGDSTQAVWRLHATLLDDRLNGDEVPGVQYRRRGFVAGLDAWSPAPLWLRLRAERDLLELRAVEERFEPTVDRARVDVGAGRAVGGGVVTLAGRGMVSNRHRPRLGGEAAWRRRAGPWIVALTAERALMLPTLDQEVLAADGASAEPERSDELSLRVEIDRTWSCSAEVARRHLGEVPFISATLPGEPWPLYSFRAIESSHTAVAGSFWSAAVSSLKLRFGGWVDYRLIDDDPRAAPAFVPELLARASLTAELRLFGADLVVLPRVDALYVGDRHDFAQQPLDTYTRVDANIIGVMLQQLDLELSFRNLTVERFILPVIDPETGEFYRDSGRNVVAGLRWRLID